MILQGDCLERLKELPADSVDALITDPPAGISFMGKAWDDDKGGRKQWIAWMTEVMTECHRVLKPGAHGLVWAIPRTSHWTGAALEDAGFEVRDVVTHLFGSGFPKSMDISKAIDKAAGAKRSIVGHQSYSAPDIRGNSYDQGHVADRERLGVAITAPATDAAKQWQGYGTALKPAAEFWFLVRKPISEKNVAANVLKWGVGGLNIDACRIGISKSDDIYAKNPNTKNKKGPQSFGGAGAAYSVPEGRFPANLVLSHSTHCTDDACDMFECPVAMLDEQSGNRHSSGLYENKGIGSGNGSTYAKQKPTGAMYSDSGGASRFFYCAKTSTSERNAGLEGMPDVTMGIGDERPSGQSMQRLDGREARAVKNHHPTVKPQKLMRYLCRLITPPKGTVLDPFMGSGSTGVAAKAEGFEFIGIEREPEYITIAEKRIDHVSQAP